MRCPRCEYQSPFDRVRCPDCEATFEADLLEDLGHLEYVHGRLRSWAEQGVLSGEVVGTLTTEIDQQSTLLKEALGIAPVEAAAPELVEPRLAWAGVGPAGTVVEAPTPVAGPAVEAPAPVAPLAAEAPVAAVLPVPAALPGTTAATTREPSPPAFRWQEVGTYLLSERTLHTVLGLGALLILASGVVISTLNPTGLGPLLHLAAVLATTLLFYAAGYVVRQKLALTMTGAALLAIGGAFVPLSIWTLGQEKLLDWQPAAIWLVASLICLPLYLASHAALRDRTFAVLASLAGASELLAVLNWMRVPLEWGLCATLVLALGYLLLAKRLPARWAALAWALFWSAQVAAPLIMALLMATKFFPAVYEVSVGRALGGWYEYAVGTAWWLGTGFYALAAHLYKRRRYTVVAAWTLPCAYLFTLTRAPWDASWYNLCLALLAGAYLLFGRLTVGRAWSTEQPPAYRALRGEPVFQVALMLTGIAALWPARTTASEPATLLVLSSVYAGATVLLRQRAWAYVAVSLLLVAWARLQQYYGLGEPLRPLAWVGLAAVLLAVAELALTASGERRRRPLETILGRGAWRSRFGSPLLLAGYAASLVALGMGMAAYGRAPAAGGGRTLDLQQILAFLGLVTLYALSAAGRRTSFFLYPATWLFLIPFTSGARLLYGTLGLVLVEHDQARLLAFLAIAYLALGYLADRLSGHYSKPIWLAGYALSLAAMPLSALDRAINVQVVGLGILAYAGSAWLVHRGRHHAYQWLVARWFRDAAAAAHARALFLYLACWLFPGWLLLALSLWQPAPAVAHYGLALTLLAPVYAAAGRLIRRVVPEYRWPWYLAGYALSVIGPLVASPDRDPRALSLAISVGLYAASAVVARRSAWLYPVALLMPIVLWQTLDRSALFDRHYGLGLVALGLLYGGLALLLHQASPRHLARPIVGPVGPYALPFLTVGYGLSAFGLARVANQDSGLVVLGFLLAALHYGGSALVLGESVFAYPLVGTLSVAYVVGMTMTTLDSRLYGLGLLPGIAAFLLVAERLRRRRDGSGRPAPAGPRLDSSSTPFYAAAYLATIAMPFASTAEQGVWALAWWSVAAVFLVSTALFRHPGWLYPTIGSALVAYAATGYLLKPDLARADLMAAFIGPIWLLFGLAYLLGRGDRSPRGQVVRDRLRLPLLPWGLEQRWIAPLVVYGWGMLAYTTLVELADAQAGLRLALAYAVLLVTLALLTGGLFEVWASLAVGALAFQQALRVLEVMPRDQPPRWALAMLVLTLLAIDLRRRAVGRLGLWARPLYLTSIGLGGAAMLGAVLLQLLQHDRAALQPLAATSAITGLTLVAHGFDRRERILGYQGVALLEVGYMLQLVFFDVGQAQAFVMPAGLYLLAVGYLEWRRGTGAGIKPVLELGGLALLLSTSLLQAVGFLGDGHDRYVYDTLLLLESTTLLGLGAILHWRRTFFAGALALVADVAILLADPLKAMNTWYLAALIGFVMIGVVIFVERQRQRIPFWLDEWRQRLETWD